MTTRMEVVELHKYPSYMNECCELLNSEWKRSITARMHSLEKSGDKLPTSLILVATNNDKKEVIGHSRLSVFCPDDPHGCLIESVLIKNERRGEGLGKFLMEKTEAHAKRLGYKTAYLSTGDKKGFYEHLGYNHFEFENVFYRRLDKKNSSSTNSFVNEKKETKQQEIINNDKIITTVLDSKFEELSLLQSHPPLPPTSPASFLAPVSLPPPPPPLLRLPAPQFKNIFNREITYWMKKTL